MSEVFLSTARQDWNDGLDRFFADLSEDLGASLGSKFPIYATSSDRRADAAVAERELADAACFVAVTSRMYTHSPDALAEMRVFDSRVRAYVERGGRRPPVMVKLHWRGPDRPTLRDGAAWADFEPEIGSYDLDGLQALIVDERLAGDYQRFRRLLVDHIHEVVGSGFLLPAPTTTLRRAVQSVEVEEDRPPRVIDPRDVTPAFHGDAADGPDMLGVDDDATAFALLLASARLRPPLALALYGRWGSGKTFIMKRIEIRIAALAATGDPRFCGNVTSVWFNAWHYAGADLWSSLIHQIFASLRGDRSDHQQQIDKVLASIQGFAEARSDAEARIGAAKDETYQLQQVVDQRVTAYQEALTEATKVKARDVLAELRSDGELASLRASLDEATGSLGLGTVGGDVHQMEDAAEHVIDAAQNVRRLSVAGPWWCSPLTLGLVIAMVLAVAGVVVDHTVRWLSAGPLIQILAIGSGLTAWIARQSYLLPKLLAPANNMRQAIQKRLDETTRTYEQDVARLGAELEAAGAELSAARARLDTARDGERAAETELAELTGPRRLERYLTERASSTDYAPYLGVVALAHRDLQDLDGYLRKTGADDKTSIDRIVLYIDDLDRCDPPTVIRVLEAVHLLLAAQTFVVVVGVDPRWLARSLREWHPSTGSQPHVEIDPADYLDKIFQLSYQVPAITGSTGAALLRRLAEDGRVRPADSIPAQSPADGTEEVDADDMRRDIAGQDVPSIASDDFSDAEIGTIELVAPLVSQSPRLLKRFLNTYRIVRARALMDSTLGPLLDGDGGIVHLRHVQVVTALAIGLPQVLSAVEVEDGSPDLRSWVETQVNEVDRAESRNLLNQFLEDCGPLAEVPVGELRIWLDIVRRFTAQADIGR